MEDCIFCKIIKGEIPAVKVYEDDSVLAFLDHQPDTPGHTLVIPKSHSENVFDIPETDLEKVMVVAKKLAIQMKDNLAADGVHLNNNNGADAHQIVFHFHMHVVPRYKNDGLEMYGSRMKIKPTEEELKETAEKIKGR